MPRSNHPRRGRRSPSDDEDRPLSVGSLRRVEGEWVVQRVAGNDSGRSYTCPGCRQQVSAGVPHVVAWPAQASVGQGDAVDARRHWHTPCWEARNRRR